MNQQQFDEDNADEHPATLNGNDWWHDFRGNPIREMFDKVGRSWHRSMIQEDTPQAR